VTVAVLVVPPRTFDGLSANRTTAIGATVRVAVRVTPPALAEIVTGAADVAADVVTVNWALTAPSGTATVVGALASAGFELESAIAKPPAGAAPLRVTVAVLEVPPHTVAGLSVTDAGESGPTSRSAVRTSPPAEAEIVTVVRTVTMEVVMLNWAVVAPSGTVTTEGTAATTPLELERTTGTPPDSAAALIATVPVLGTPPSTFAGLNETDVTDRGRTVSVAVWVKPPAEAEMVTGVADVTGEVVTAN
jgi:hypothetical protein